MDNIMMLMIIDAQHLEACLCWHMVLSCLAYTSDTHTNKITCHLLQTPDIAVNQTSRCEAQAGAQYWKLPPSAAQPATKAAATHPAGSP